MKSNKLAWVSSLLITLLGLGGAIIFNFKCKCINSFWGDLCMGIFASAALVFANSLILYLVERKKLRSEIYYKSQGISFFYYVVEIVGSINNVTVQDIRILLGKEKRVIDDLLKVVADYIAGKLFCKKKLKQLMKDCEPLYDEVAELMSYMTCDGIDTNLVSAKIKTIGELETELQNKYQKFFKKKENEVEPELSREEFKKQYEEKAKSKENDNNG